MRSASLVQEGAVDMLELKTVALAKLRAKVAHDYEVIEGFGGELRVYPDAGRGATELPPQIVVDVLGLPPGALVTPIELTQLQKELAEARSCVTAAADTTTVTTTAAARAAVEVDSPQSPPP